MLKKVVAFCTVVMFLLVGAVGVGAITWGQPDGYGHPHVVEILFARPDGYYSCTGTLLTPYVVLTAGHCTEDIGIVNAATWVRNDPDIDAAFAAERPLYASTLDWLNDRWTPGQAVPHPLYNDYAQFPVTYDIGLVLLSEPLYVPLYGAMPGLLQFEYLRTARGPISQRRVVDVGYGLQGRIPAFAGDDWERYRGDSAIINTGQAGTAGYQNFMFTNSPGVGHGSGGTCSGDSGGPAFWVDPVTGQETNIIVAVNSYSVTPNCNGNDYMFRADTTDALNFVSPYLGWMPS